MDERKIRKICKKLTKIFNVKSTYEFNILEKEYVIYIDDIDVFLSDDFQNYIINILTKDFNKNIMPNYSFFYL